MGFRGKSSSLAQLAFVVAPSFILFGYNQAGVGGLLSLSDWSMYSSQHDENVTEVYGTITYSYISGLTMTANRVDSENLPTD